MIEISFEKADGKARRELSDDKFGYSKATKARKRQDYKIDPFTDEYNKQLDKRRTFYKIFSDQREKNEERKKRLM